MNKIGINLRPVFIHFIILNFINLKVTKMNFPFQKKFSRYGINLPSYFDLDKKDLDTITKHIQKYFFLNKLI